MYLPKEEVRFHLLTPNLRSSFESFVNLPKEVVEFHVLIQRVTEFDVLTQSSEVLCTYLKK